VNSSMSVFMNKAVGTSAYLLTLNLSVDTCELRTLRTRYFYMHFLLIFAVMILYCFVVCV